MGRARLEKEYVVVLPTVDCTATQAVPRVGGWQIPRLWKCCRAWEQVLATGS